MPKRAGEAARLIDPLHPSVRPSHETDDSDSAEAERMDREKRGRKKKRQRVEELPQTKPSKPRREKTPLRKDRVQAGRKRDTSEDSELKEYKGLNEQELKAFRQYMQEKQGQEVCKKFGVKKHPAAAVDSVFCSPPSAPRGRGRSNLTPVQRKIRKNNYADEEEDEDVHEDDTARMKTPKRSISQPTMKRMYDSRRAVSCYSFLLTAGATGFRDDDSETFKDKIMAFWRWGEGSGKLSGSKFKTEQGSTTRVRLCRFFP
tara:strand:+ start:66 stop:842 length:777 start_codon:yes stop_codon:yes gene_type:complete